MLREMRRWKQALTREECISILKDEPRGILSLNGDDGYPYGLPLNHFYDEEKGRLYFHGAAEGYKIDCIRRNNKASFCVYDRGYNEDDDWALHIKSVIVTGTVHIVEDREEMLEYCRRLSYKFTDDSEYIEKVIKSSGGRVFCYYIEIENMTGKLVEEK